MYMPELCKKLLAAPPPQRNQMPLSQLRVLSLRFGKPDYTANIELFQPLIKLPTIETLTLYRFTADDTKPFSQMPQLWSLNLWRCMIPTASIYLKVVWAGYRVNRSAIGITISYADFATAICQRTKGLKRFVPDVRQVVALGVVTCMDQEREDTLDLSSHQSLEEVTLAGCAFWTVASEGENTQIRTSSRLHRILPASLRRLAILTNREASGRIPDTDLVVPDILSLVIQDPSALQSIHIDGQIKVSDWHDSEGLQGDQRFLEKAGWQKCDAINDSMVIRISPAISTTTAEQETILGPYSRFWAPGYTNVTTKLERVGDDELSSEQRTAWEEELEQRASRQTTPTADDLTTAFATLQTA
ncbi:hypothetical protein Slin15195_G021850 [Septoria linicola]|uniref:Uncharacterized protein n=1 Tax=Septoria linicola TaxID=215465 RepID=A0A9Q9AQB3_9PEZI|nr:hypothetical protein Slin15195_G021850 [Septoria linicola]